MNEIALVFRSGERFGWGALRSYEGDTFTVAVPAVALASLGYPARAEATLTVKHKEVVRFCAQGPPSPLRQAQREADALNASARVGERLGKRPLARWLGGGERLALLLSPSDARWLARVLGIALEATGASAEDRRAVARLADPLDQALASAPDAPSPLEG